MSRYAAAYAELRALQDELAELTTRARERAQEADLLRFGLEEIEAVDPQAGEDVDLAHEEERLAHADALRGAAESARTALIRDAEGGDEAGDAAGLVSAATVSLEQEGGHDPALAELAGRLAEVGYLVADVAADLASYVAGIETDPARLATVSERRAAISRLTRKYGDSAAEVLAWAQRSAARLTTLEGDDERIVAFCRSARVPCGTSSRARRRRCPRRAARRRDRFATAVSAELAALAMPQARVEVAVGADREP